MDIDVSRYLIYKVNKRTSLVINNMGCNGNYGCRCASCYADTLNALKREAETERRRREEEDRKRELAAQWERNRRENAEYERKRQEEAARQQAMKERLEAERNRQTYKSVQNGKATSSGTWSRYENEQCPKRIVINGVYFKLDGDAAANVRQQRSHILQSKFNLTLEVAKSSTEHFFIIDDKCGHETCRGPIKLRSSYFTCYYKAVDYYNQTKTSCSLVSQKRLYKFFIVQLKKLQINKRPDF